MEMTKIKIVEEQEEVFPRDFDLDFHDPIGDVEPPKTPTETSTK